MQQYFLIQIKKGKPSIEIISEADAVVEMNADNTKADFLKFEIPDPDILGFGQNRIIIKGELVRAKPVEKVTTYELTTDPIPIPEPIVEEI